MQASLPCPPRPFVCRSSGAPPGGSRAEPWPRCLRLPDDPPPPGLRLPRRGPRRGIVRDGRVPARLRDLSDPAAPDGVGDLHRGRDRPRRRPALAGSLSSRSARRTARASSRTAQARGGRSREGMRCSPSGSTRAPQGGKGPRLTARLDAAADARGRLAGPVRAGRRAAPARCSGWRGPVARTRPIQIGRSRRSPRRCARRCGRPPPRSWRGAFADAALREAESDALREPGAALPGGADREHVHPTPALVALDLDGCGPPAPRRAAPRRRRSARRTPRGAAGARAPGPRSATWPARSCSTSPAWRRNAARRWGRSWTEALRGGPARPAAASASQQLGLAEIVRPRVHPAACTSCWPGRTRRGWQGCATSLGRWPPSPGRRGRCGRRRTWSRRCRLTRWRWGTLRDARGGP